MPRRLVLLVVAIVLCGVAWRPLLKPAGQAAILILDIYSPTLIGTNVAALVTPEPRVTETTETYAGVTMRVTWWHPGLGARHPAVMVVNGATPQGNDNEATRQLGVAMARAGYLVMLPEFPFLKVGRFERGATQQIDAAFAALRARDETRGRAVGTFGASVGGGVMLAAAGPGSALSGAAYLSVLGGYYDIDTYLASVASHSQLMQGRLEPWVPSDEAQERLPKAALEAVPPADQAVLKDALAPRSYSDVLARLQQLSPEARATFDALSPQTVWSGIRPPIFWLHDPEDSFEPLAEAHAAAAAPRQARMTLVVPQLVSHAAPKTGGGGLLFTLGELWRLLSFTFEVLRLAG